MFAFLKRFRRKKPVVKPVESLRAVKFDQPPMPVTRPPRAAYVRTPTVEHTTIERRVEVHVEESPIAYYTTPLYVPMDISPSVEVYAPSVEPSPSYDCSPSYSAPDTSSSYDCSSSSIDYGSGSSDTSWS